MHTQSQQHEQQTAKKTVEEGLRDMFDPPPWKVAANTAIMCVAASPFAIGIGYALILLAKPKSTDF